MATPTIYDELAALLGPDAVLGPDVLRLRARNYWDPEPLDALALARPSTTTQVSQVMRLCAARGQTVVVHGGLTGVCGGDAATRSDVILSLERMNAIEEIDPIGRTATVQAGCKLETLQNAVDSAGLFFPLDLGARGSCTIGGNVATNAGGINVIRYGMMRALVLGVEAVLADGTIVSSLNRMLKNNTGYDLKQLFIGTEGTLGIVTRVVVALKEKSPGVDTALVALDDGAKLAPLLKHMDRALGGTLTSYEVMWGDYYREVTLPGRHRAPLDRTYPFYAIVEAQGSGDASDGARFEQAVSQALEQSLVVDAILPKSGAERADIWKVRENFEAVLTEDPVFLYDVSVPLRDAVAYVEDVRAALARHWPSCLALALGHLGDGNVHFFIAPRTSSGDFATMHAESDAIVYAPLARIGGAVSAEHGIGLEKKRWMPVSRSPEEIALMHTLKRAFDPRNLLNPGRIVDVD